MSRAACISAIESAIQFWIVCFSASVDPCAYRDTARSHSMSNARLDWPSQRMQWWIRPGPSRFCASANPDPSRPIRFPTGTRTSVYTISAWLPKRPNGVSGSSIVATSRTMSTPGVATGTTIIDDP